MIDRICVKVQDHLNSLRNCGVDAVQEDVKSAERLMRDAKNSKTVSLSQQTDNTERSSTCACSLLLLGGYDNTVSQVHVFFIRSASDDIYKFFSLAEKFPPVCSDLKTGSKEPAF